MDKFVNTSLFNIPNFLLVIVSLVLLISVTHIFVTKGSN